MMHEIEHFQLFPNEAFDESPESVSENELGSSFQGHVEMVAQLNNASQKVRNAYDGTWDKAHEHELADSIQAGLAAKSAAIDMGEEYDGRFDEVVRTGHDAQYNLVVANLPFAAYLARASVGIRRLPDNKSGGTVSIARHDGDYMGMLKEPGTYSRIANLASPNASLEDRTQVAMEAMWEAAEKFNAPKCEEKNQTAKFATYVAWYIQSALDKHVTTEFSGWYIPPYRLDMYKESLKDEKVFGTLPEIRHRGALGRGKHNGRHPDQMLAGRHGESLDSVAIEIPDEVDSLGDSIHVSLADITPTPGDSVHDQVIDKLMVEDIHLLLNTLSKREADIVSMRFGLDDGVPKTLDQVGKEYGVTTSRIGQIEKKALGRLEHQFRSQILRDYLPTSNSSVLPRDIVPIVDGASHIKTRPSEVSGGHWYGMPDQ